MIAAQVGLEEKDQAVPGTLRKRRPPGSAGVPPACTAVAIRSVCLRCITRQRRRRERPEPGRSRAVACLPVAPGGGNGGGCAETYAGETPALPGGHPARFAALPPRAGQRSPPGGARATERGAPPGTLALPGGLHPMTSSRKKMSIGHRVYPSCLATAPPPISIGGPGRSGSPAQAAANGRRSVSHPGFP